MGNHDEAPHRAGSCRHCRARCCHLQSHKQNQRTESSRTGSSLRNGIGNRIRGRGEDQNRDTLGGGSRQHKDIQRAQNSPRPAAENCPGLSRSPHQRGSPYQRQRGRAGQVHQRLNESRQAGSNQRRLNGHLQKSIQQSDGCAQQGATGIWRISQLLNER